MKRIICFLVLFGLTAPVLSQGKDGIMGQTGGLPAGMRIEGGKLILESPLDTLQLDITAIFNMSVVSNDILDIAAAAWVGTPANSASGDTLNGYIPIKDFDTVTAETLMIDFKLPSYFAIIDSIQLETGTGSTAGDSGALAFKWLGVASGESWPTNTSTFSAALADTLDFGTTANQRKIMTISGDFSAIFANDRFIGKLYRDPSISNDVAADIYLVAAIFYGRGLR